MVKKGFIALIIVGLVASIYIASQDYSLQKSNNGINMTLDFVAVKEWSEETGNSIEDILSIAKESNINYISLSEMQLKESSNRVESFADQEVDVSVYLGNEIASLKDSGVEWTNLLNHEDIKVDNFYFVSSNSKRIDEISVAAREKYGRDRVNVVSDKNSFVMELIVEPGMKVNGLGFDPREIDLIESLGLKTIPRPLNATFSSTQLDNYFSYIEELFTSKIIIFAGDDGVLGNRINSSDDLISQTALNMYPRRSDGLLYGFVEMTNIKGDKDLARKLDYNLARVHSIGEDEWDKRYNTFDADSLTIKEVVERYALAVNDRSVNILYMRPFTKGIDFNQEFFVAINEKFANQGHITDGINVIPTRGSLPRLVSIMLLIGLGGALGILFLNIFPKHEKVAILLVLIGAAGGSFLIYSGYQGFINRWGAFFVAITFPTVGVIWGYINNEKKSADIKNSVVSFAKAVVISVIGGFYVHAFLATAPFMTSIDVFPMVKIALIAPLIIVSFLYIVKEDALSGLIEFMKMKIQVYHLAILGVAFVALVFMAMRSGNNPIIPVTSFETRLRLFLQSSLSARPRFKEFAIGYPVLLVAGTFLNTKIAKVGIVLGTIGLSSLVNTFAHLHKPLNMAFFTTINGVIAGLVIGIIGSIIIKKLVSLIWSESVE
ncbi:MAG: DUF5693 family protein [Clostridia bacterium]